MQIEVLRATPAQLDETGTLGGSVAASFISLGGGTLSFWSVEKGETLTDLVVEEFELEGALATQRPSPSLSQLPQTSIALVDGIPGRSVVSYAPQTLPEPPSFSRRLKLSTANCCVGLTHNRYLGDDGHSIALALWDTVGRRPVANWAAEIDPGQSSWILGQTALVGQHDEILVAAVGAYRHASSYNGTQWDSVPCVVVHFLANNVCARTWCPHTGGRTVQCWQLKPLEGAAGTVTVARTISLPSPIVSYHFGSGGNATILAASEHLSLQTEDVCCCFRV